MTDRVVISGRGVESRGEPIFSRCIEMISDRSIVEDVEKVAQRGVPQLGLLLYPFAVEPRQNAARAIQPDVADVNFRRLILRRGTNSADFGMRESHGHRGAKPNEVSPRGRGSGVRFRGLRFAVEPILLFQQSDGLDKFEAIRPLEQQIDQSNIRSPARAGHWYRYPGFPRAQTLRRVKEFIVTCSEKTRSRMAARR